MAKEVKKLDGSKIEITVEVSPERLEQGVQSAYIKNRKKFNVPGFRKGKAPRKVIENYYGEGIFLDDAFDEVFPEVYGRIIDDNKLDVVSRPENLKMDKFSKEEGILCTVEAYVKPEVVVKDYKGVEIEKRETKVGAKEVNAEIERVRQENIRWIEVDRAAKEGDTIVLDYSGTVDGKKFDGGTAEGQSLLLGSSAFIPGFEDQLIGVRAGDKKDVELSFPEEYPVDSLNGREAVFACNIICVKEKEVPDVDDDFASDVSEFDTLAEYKKDIKKKLTDRQKRIAKDEMENELIEKIVRATDIDVPECMIESQIDYAMQQFSYQLLYQGFKIEDYCKYTGKTMEDLRNDQRDSALLQVKTQLVLNALIKQENIEAPEKDIEVLIADAADQLSKSVEDYKKEMKEDDREYFESRVKVDKLFEMLMAEAKLVEKAEEETSSAKKTEKPASEKKPAAKKTAAKKPASKKTVSEKTDDAAKDDK